MEALKGGIGLPISAAGDCWRACRRQLQSYAHVYGAGQALAAHESQISSTLEEERRPPQLSPVERCSPHRRLSLRLANRRRIRCRLRGLRRRIRHGSASPRGHMLHKIKTQKEKEDLREMRAVRDTSTTNALGLKRLIRRAEIRATDRTVHKVTVSQL